MRTKVIMTALFWAWAGCSDPNTEYGDTGPGGDGGVDLKQKNEAGIGNDVKPKLIKGGGTGGGAIDGRLNVYVVEADTGKPLQGAFVMVGDGAKHQGSTGADGLVTFRAAGLKGPLGITTALKGYTIFTVEGLDAANATVTLSPRAGGANKVKTGTCKGTISGWSALPAPAKNHMRVGMVGFLLDQRLDAPRNGVDQPKGDLNLYAPGAPMHKDSWQVTVPAGSFGVFAMVLDLDTKGTSSDKDDTFQLTHLGVKTGLKVQQGQTLSGVVIPVSPTSYTLKVTLPPKPAGTKAVGASALVELANKEVVPLFMNSAVPGQVPVPKLEGDFKGGSFWAIVGADDGKEHEDDDRNNESVFIKRGITGVAQPVAASLMPLPGGHAVAAGGKVSFSPPAGASMCTIGLMPEKTGAPYWQVHFFKPG